jgi:hypothetical protein
MTFLRLTALSLNVALRWLIDGIERCRRGSECGDVVLISFRLAWVVDHLGDLLGDLVDAELVGTQRNFIGE